MKKVAIAGATGGFGRLLTEMFLREGVWVGGIDVIKGAHPNINEFVQGNVTDLNLESKQLIHRSDAIIFALPESVAVEAVDKVVAHMSKGTLLVDILSVKTEIVNRMRDVEKEIEKLSLHPMFAPSLGFEAQNVVVLDVDGREHANEFIKYLEKWGSRLTYMSAEQHDRSTACVQVAVHAAVISYGRALYKLNYKIDEVLPIATPPHKILLAMLARILDADSDIYWKIQKSNPFAESARTSLVEGAEELNELVEADDFDKFEFILDSIRDVIAEESEFLQKTCQDLYSKIEK